MKKILFLSALDFKEKSIQVIKKTPEAYHMSGWDVTYIVARDNLSNGNYFYEKELNPKGLHLRRFYWPFPSLRANLPRHIALIVGKIASIIIIIRLFFFGYKENKIRKFDVVYGYELHGVLAMNLLRPFLRNGQRTVSRFQGTFLYEMFLKKQYSRIIFNIDLILAIWLKSNLLIMTDDGTQGDLAVKKIKKNKSFNMKFWVNGVEKRSIKVKDGQNKIEIPRKITFVSVSRLVNWKRVDRNIEILYALKKQGFSNFKYNIVGEGDKREYLEALVKDKGLTDQIMFLGALKHEEVLSQIDDADFFLSMYDSSNVGNPLLEAIRYNKLIVTLNNGDTARWIKHNENGLIYECESSFFDKAAVDIHNLIKSNIDMMRLKINLLNTEKKMLSTWTERLQNEISEVLKL